MQARTLYLYGKLGEELGKEHKIYVNSVAEAMKYLAANFGDKFYSNMKDGYYKIKKGKKNSKEFITEKDLNVGLGDYDLHLIPVAKGASTRGKQVGMIVAAVALAVVTYGASVAYQGAALTGEAGALTSTAGASSVFSNMGWVANASMNMAVAMATMGIAGLLTPIPKTDVSSETDESSTSTTVMNTERQGSVIPVIYGHVKVGSVVVSSGVSADRAATNAQYNTVMIYLQEYQKFMLEAINAYWDAMTTTAVDESTIINRDGGYYYYPGKYNRIRPEIQTIRQGFLDLYDRSVVLSKQSVVVFSIDDYKDLLDDTIDFCGNTLTALEPLYTTVSEHLDFSIYYSVQRLPSFIMDKRTRFLMDTVGVTRLRSRIVGGDEFIAYYASTLTTRSIRQASTMTPLDACYFYTGVLRYELGTLKERGVDD